MKHLLRLASALAISMLSFTCGPKQDTPIPTTDILPWEKDARYWAWDGTEPTLLLGIAVGNNRFQDSLYHQQVSALAHAGGNLLRLTISPQPYRGMEPYGVLPDGSTGFNPTYWEKLREVIDQAAKREIVVQLRLTMSIRASGQAVSYLEKMKEITRPYHNVLYPESENGEAPNTILVGNIVGFNRAVLEGNPAVVCRPKDNSLAGYEAIFTTIRTLRMVERNIDFKSVRLAPELIGKAVPGVFAVKEDLSGKMLFHLPSAGEVMMLPEVDYQVPIKFTRIGYLGTTQSETLLPPYGDSFRLFTEEEKGGWMLLEPG